jgi:hypothetical protein
VSHRPGDYNKSSFVFRTLCLAGTNTAVSTAALLLNTSGEDNTAVGTNALEFNGAASENTAVGTAALQFNIDGNPNTAVGYAALNNNLIAGGNTAVGYYALWNNDSDALGLGNGNTGVGAVALFNNVDGNDNTAVGDSAGQNMITGFNNTYIGDFVGFLAANESNTIRIGDVSNGNGAESLECYIGGIWNNFQPVGGTVVEVTLDLSNDHLGWDVGPNQHVTTLVQRGAPVPNGRLQPLTRPGPRRQAMLNRKVEKLEATVGQQQK